MSRLFLPPILLSALVAGCSLSHQVDKAGGDVVVLHLATIEGSPDDNGQSVGPRVFAAALGELSGGRLSVRLETGYGQGAPDAESLIVKDIAAGRLDGGWPASRAFQAAGFAGLRVLEAPFLLTSYAAEKAVASGPLAAELLRTLDGSGLVALGLTVGPLRRPWSLRGALLDPPSWKGLLFRVYNSPLERAVVLALGGTPVNASYGFPALVRQGHLQGVESDLATYTTNNYGALLPFAAANVVLWPKMFVLSVSQRRWNSLSTRFRGWVHAAAQKAVEASVAADYPEAGLVIKACAQGVKFAAASPDQLAGLLRRVEPVFRDLAADPTTAGPLLELRAIGARYPQADSAAVPSSCRVTA